MNGPSDTPNPDPEQRVEQRTAALKRREAKLRNSEEMFRMLLDGIKDYAVYMLDGDGHVVSWNAGAAHIKGYQAEEIIGKHISCFYTATDRERNYPEASLREAAREGRFEREGWQVRKDGSAFWADTVITPLYEANNSLRGYSTVVRNITDRKQTELELEKQAALLDLAHDAIMVRDLRGRIIFWNRGAEQMYGWFAAEAKGQTTQILLQTVFPIPLAAIEAVVASKGEWEGELRHRTRQDREVIVGSRWSQYRDEHGEPAATLIINRDITDRKLAELALSESESRLAGIIASAMDSIITVDEQQLIVLFNRSAEKMFRCLQSEAMGKPITRFIPQLFHAGHDGRIQKPGELGVTTRSMVTQDVLWALAADGREFHIEASISQVVTGGKKLFTVILRDVSERVQAEEVRDRLAAVVDSSNDAIISKTLDGTILAWNRGAEEIFGYAASEVVGKAVLVLVPPDRVEEEIDILARIRRGDSVKHFETVRIRKDGTRIDVSATISPIRDTSGVIIGVSKVARDITERKRSEAEAAQQAEELLRSKQEVQSQKLMLQSVMDSMVEGLVAADEQGNFLLWNPAALSILGLGKANVSPEDWSAYYGVYLPDTITPFPSEQNPLLRAIRGEVSSAEMFIRNPKLDHGVWIESNGAPLLDEDGGLRGGVVAFRDITRRKANELEIRTLNEKLEEKIAQRTVQLKTANQELEAFSYSVSHDLRAPLRHIDGFSRILINDFAPGMAVEAKEHLERIQAAVVRMGLLVDGLLSLAKLGRQSLRLRRTELNDIVEHVISVMKPECEGREIDWRIAALPTLQCDQFLVGQIFHNLLGNALKYSALRNKSVIEVGRIDEAGKPVVIFVRDNGAGFDMKYATKLFGVFQRMHTESEFEGTGVGLATVHRIIQKHGGRIWAEAAVDSGATFYFTLGGS